MFIPLKMVLIGIDPYPNILKLSEKNWKFLHPPHGGYTGYTCSSSALDI
jgi:hypothetical protein